MSVILKLNYLITGFLMIFSLFTYGQNYNTEVEAKINLNQQGDRIEIIGSAFNKTEVNMSLRYILSVIKNGNGNNNRSKNDQSGRVVLKPNAKSNLSMTTINANEKDRIIILLLVYDFDDTLLGKDRIVINGTAEDIKEAQERKEMEKVVSLDAAHEADDGVILRGIVIEDTKTKLGRDFYKMFYSGYSSNNINGEKIVSIKEKLAQANNTKIEVDVDGFVVLEFILRPNQEFLKTMSNEALRRVYARLQKVKQEKKLTKHY